MKQILYQRRMSIDETIDETERTNSLTMVMLKKLYPQVEESDYISIEEEFGFQKFFANWESDEDYLLWCLKNCGNQEFGELF